MADDSERRKRIEQIAHDEGCDISKPGILDALLQTGSFDVQACPGSGKTTVVATKISVLLGEGKRGLCVLTHTNVAVEEIRSRLQRSKLGRAALSAPHFIGTIQGFVNTFLALPYIRAKGGSISQIDDDAFSAAVAEELERGDYHKLAAWLKRNKGKATSYRVLEYDHRSGALTFKGEKIGLVDPTTDAYKELKSLKTRLSKNGIFRHADMYFFANRYLDEYPWAASVLQRRFDVVLLDEMQDTSTRQESLLNRMFPAESVDVQRFGDVNQAIYEFDASAEDCVTRFPCEPILYLGSSRRFGQFIAGSIASIAPQRQTILGDESAPTATHTIFLFDEATAHKVVEKFAELASRELAGVEQPDVRVVATRKRPSETGGTFPHSLCDYVKDAADPKQGRRGNADRFIAAAFRVQSQATAQAPAQPIAELFAAFQRLVSRWTDRERARRFLSDVSRDWKSRAELGRLILNIASADLGSETKWLEIIDPLKDYIAQNIGSQASIAALRYLEYVEDYGGETLGTPKEKAFALPLKLDTIHSVKGQTHDATLVLETQYYEHDISEILPLLADPLGKRKNTARFIGHRRRLFVAMSRPSRLLCLASTAASVNDALRDALERQGWQICDLTSKA
ncbi:MAG: UvrD-helicase domain-containing protein [bacterium]|nr:UvrD-helicase domain-containing protein [bacterium]